MRKVFRATHVSIDAEEDKYQEGCIPETRHCKVSEKCDIEGNSITDVINKLSNIWGLEEDPTSWRIYNHDLVQQLEYCQLEDANGCQLGEHGLDLWKKGDIKAWLVDYMFHLDVYMMEPATITDEEISAAGIERS